MNDHESSFVLSTQVDVDLPISALDMKRNLQETINDSIEERREGAATAEACITPSEPVMTEGYINLHRNQT